MLAALRREPRNDDVVANLDFYDDLGGVLLKRHRSTATGLPVDGAVTLAVAVR